MKKNKALLISAIVFVVYWLVAVFVPSEALRLTFTGMALGVSTIIVITWAPDTWSAIKRGAEDPEDQMVIAVFMTWASLVLARLYAAVYYLLDQPAWLSRLPISGFVALAAAVAGLLFLTAPGLMPDAVRGRYKTHVLMAFGLGLLIAGFMLGVNGGYTVGLEVN